MKKYFLFISILLISCGHYPNHIKNLSGFPIELEYTPPAIEIEISNYPEDTLMTYITIYKSGKSIFAKGIKKIRSAAFQTIERKDILLTQEQIKLLSNKINKIERLHHSNKKKCSTWKIYAGITKENLYDTIVYICYDDNMKDIERDFSIYLQHLSPLYLILPTNHTK